MKHVYLIGGTMGVGKTTLCQALKEHLNYSVFLDGDWCWDSHPFVVTEETKTMVMNNICFLLNSFIHTSAYNHIIFCWVMHQQDIIDEIISRLDTTDCMVHPISLIVDEEHLRARLEKDIEAGLRQEDVIERSIERLHLYDDLNTQKIDTSHRCVEEIISLLLQKVDEK